MKVGRQARLTHAVDTYAHLQYFCSMTHHAKSTLRELGYRLTPQRTLVWDVLRSGGGHMAAEEICHEVQRSFPHINLSTVYRTLDLLVELNLVKETCIGPERRYYEIEEEIPHHHLVCEGCGRIIHVHDEDLEGLANGLETNHGFLVHEVTVFGVCGSCEHGAGEKRPQDAHP
jgi:Fur family ferric uptake transcriptional regulator